MFSRLIVVTVLLCIAASVADGQITFVNGVPTYRFPERWQSASGGWVSDCFTFHNRVYVSGFIYTDYTLGVQRVDEVWNLTSTWNTGLAQWGVVADTHLFEASGKSWYFFYNSSGPQCSTSLSGLIKQDQFASPSTYVGNVSAPDGRILYEFASHFPFPLNHLSISFFVDAKRQVPVEMFVPKLGKLFDGTLVLYADFSAVDAWPSAAVFDKPAFCSSAGLATPPGC